eukprot:4729005-Pyramimonas_sp.AAC.1
MESATEHDTHNCGTHPAGRCAAPARHPAVALGARRPPESTKPREAPAMPRGGPEGPQRPMGCP